MERDSIIGHGMARFLKERMLDTADGYITYICDICGMDAQRVKKENSHPSKKDIYHCPGCKNKTKISKIMIPYAMKLFRHELAAMNIAARFRTMKSIYSHGNI